MKHVIIPLGLILGGLITAPFIPLPVRLIAIAIACWVLFRLWEVRRKNNQKEQARMAINAVFESDRT